jgi:rod shape-determining protein MreC
VAAYRQTHRARYVLAVLVLAALTLITIDARSNGTGFLGRVRDRVSDEFAPVQRVTHTALRPIGNFLTGVVDYGSVRSENQRLRDEVAGLQKQSIQAAAQQAAADQVLSEQHLPFVGAIPTVSVEIIDSGSSNFENSVLIDKGTTSGIAPGQPVVAAGGLVGSVASASAHTATVVLLTDPTVSVGIRLQGNNIGTAEGTGRSNPLRVTVDTPNRTTPKMAVGQSVVTSGLNFEKFPGGIPVGRVSSYSMPPGATEPTIALTPLVNVSQLTYLQVLLWLGGP